LIKIASSFLLNWMCRQYRKDSCMNQKWMCRKWVCYVFSLFAAYYA
jgi:hypothetical protein